MACSSFVILMLMFSIHTLHPGVVAAATTQCSGMYSEANGSYTVQWNLMGNIITFTVTVDITPFNIEFDAWVALGFSNNSDPGLPFMFPSDIYMVNNFNAEVVEIDERYSVGHSEPLRDDILNVLFFQISRNNSIHTMTFSRRLVTGDTAQDVTLDVPRYWIWAVGNLGDGIGILDQHPANGRGTVTDGPIVLPSPLDCGVALSTDSNVKVEIGRRVDIECTVLSESIELTWYRNVNGQLLPVQRESVFTFDNLREFVFPLEDIINSQFTLFPNRTVQDFQDAIVSDRFFSDQNGLQGLSLTSWRTTGENQVQYLLSPSTAIAGNYTCVGTDISEGLVFNATVSIEFEEPSPEADFSNAFVRADIDLFELFPFDKIEFQLALLESYLIETVDINRPSIPAFNCTVIEFEPPSSSNPLFFTSRIECQIKEFPPSGSTLFLAEQSFNDTSFTSVNISETGFCSNEFTSDGIYGNYTWPETVGGQTISFPCNTDVQTSDPTVKRTCLGPVLGWNTIIDFTNCRPFVQFPVIFEFYLRFSSNFNLLSSETALDNIRIVIELSNNAISSTDCSSVSDISSTNSMERIECKIDGTANSQADLLLDEQVIVSGLIAEQLLEPGSSISDVEGYCNPDTTEGQAGTFSWPESVVGAFVKLLCPFGPVNASASRTCVSRLTWGEPDTSSCATLVTQGLQMLGNDLSQITTETVAEFTSNISDFVNNATSQDQTEANTIIVTQAIIRALEITVSPNANLPTIISVTTDVVSILDDVEEWPPEVIEEQSPIIIMTFEDIAGNLVQQENFTNLTVSTEDVVFVAQRVDSDNLEQNGRTFTVKDINGMLQVNSTNDQVIPDLADDESAILSFPSGIDLGELTGASEENIGLYFVVYDKDTWFPLRVQDERERLELDLVGSVVAGFTIPTLPEGTILSQPVTISMRIEDPLTGSSENITDATCVFYNFTRLRWDSTGCETVYDPDTNPEEVLCKCTHLTNFAVLVDISSRIDDTPPVLTEKQLLSLNVITYLGVVLSLIGLMITFITIIMFKEIRQRDVTKFHLQLCLALACMYLVFVCGIGSTDNRGGCVTVGTMILYFTLVAWMWMGAEALLMFQKLIIVFGTKTWKYLLLVSVVCWSVPLIFVVIPVAIDPDYYITTFDDNSNRTGFCFISNVGVFFGAFLGPILLVIIFNTVVFILVIRVLINHNIQKNKVKKSSITALETFKLILSISGIMFLFGLSWIFAIFTFTTTDSTASYAFQVLFALPNAFQGFWICFFFVFLNAEARDAWKLLIFHCNNKSMSSSAKMGLSSNNKKANPTSKTTDTTSMDMDGGMTSMNGTMNSIDGGTSHCAMIDNDYVMSQPSQNKTSPAPNESTSINDNDTTEQAGNTVDEEIVTTPSDNQISETSMNSNKTEQSNDETDNYETTTG